MSRRLGRGASHQGRVRGDADTESRHALGATRFRHLHRPQECGNVPGDHRLPGTVVVGDGDDASVGRVVTDGRQRIGVQTDHRGHTARILFTRLLHEAATLPHQLQPGWKIHHAGGDERGELTERVTGDHGWDRPSVRLRRAAP